MSEDLDEVAELRRQLSIARSWAWGAHHLMWKYGWFPEAWRPGDGEWTLPEWLSTSVEPGHQPWFADPDGPGRPAEQASVDTRAEEDHLGERTVSRLDDDLASLPRQDDAHGAHAAVDLALAARRFARQLWRDLTPEERYVYRVRRQVPSWSEGRELARDDADHLRDTAGRDEDWPFPDA